MAEEKKGRLGKEEIGREKPKKEILRKELGEDENDKILLRPNTIILFINK